MTGTKGNSEFCPPWSSTFASAFPQGASRASGKQNSLFRGGGNSLQGKYQQPISLEVDSDGYYWQPWRRVYEVVHIPLVTNQVQGPCCKLHTKSSPLWFMTHVALCLGHKSRGKKWGSVTYRTEQEDGVGKISIIFSVYLMGLETTSIHMEWLQISYTCWKQNRSVWNCYYWSVSC